MWFVLIPEALGDRFAIIQAATGQKVPHQILRGWQLPLCRQRRPRHRLPDLFAWFQPRARIHPAVTAQENQMENRFYRLTFNPRTGALASIWDKELGRELVDQSAPHQFNEYLYERYEKSPPRCYFGLVSGGIRQT